MIHEINTEEGAAMIAVTVNRLDLLEKLKARREAHKTAYAEAFHGWKAEAAEILEARRAEFDKAVTALLARVEAADLDRGQAPVPLALSPDLISFVPRPPTNHEDDYDQAIDALTYDVRDTVEVPPELFDQWVRDKFTWKADFMAAHESYGGKAGSAPRRVGA